MPPASGTCWRFCVQPRVGGGDHRGHPFARRVQHGAPRPGGLLGVQRLAEPGRMLLAGAVAPPRLTGVGEEHHRPHHAVGQRLGVAVGVVGLRALQAVGTALVGDERDRAVVAAERRAGQRQPARRVVERLADGVAPALGVAAVVDLVEHDERLAVLGAHPVPRRVAGHLGVGDDDAVVLVGVLRGGVAELRVERDADAGRRLRPLDLEVFGRHHDGDPLDGAVGQQLARRCAAQTSSCLSPGSPRPGSLAAARQDTAPRPDAASPAKPGCWALRKPAPEDSSSDRRAV